MRRRHTIEGTDTGHDQDAAEDRQRQDTYPGKALSHALAACDSFPSPERPNPVTDTSPDDVDTPPPDDVGTHPAGDVNLAKEAARDALTEVLAQPVADVVMRGVRIFGGGGAGGEWVDEITKTVATAADPARVPAKLAGWAAAHLVAQLAVGLGPIGPVVAIFAGDFAKNLTRQALDSDRDIPAVDRTETVIEVAGTLGDAWVGRLADSEPFREYVSDLADEEIAAILYGDARPGADRAPEPVTGPKGTITAVVTAYEFRCPADDPAVVRVRPAPLTALECIPAAAVTGRWWHDEYDVLLLADGTRVKRRGDGQLPGRWVRVPG